MAVKLVIALVQDYDASQLMAALTAADFRVTRIVSKGGFLRTGNTTLLIGVDDRDVQHVAQLIEANCRERIESIQPEFVGDLMDWYPTDSIDVLVGGATVFVVNVARFEQY